jgi:hypothetical protein
VVINNFNMTSVALSPHKAHTPLVIDANAVLPLATTGQSLKPVVGWYAQIIKPGGAIDHLELALGHRPDIGKPGHSLTGKHGQRICTLKRLNHGSDYLTTNVIRQAFH